MNATHVVTVENGQRAKLGEQVELLRVLKTRAAGLAVWKLADGKTDKFPLEWAEPLEQQTGEAR